MWSVNFFFMKLNHQVLMQNRELLDNYKDYLPLALHGYVSLNYYDNATDKALQEYYNKRIQLQREDKGSDFVIKDLKRWIKKNPEFKYLLVDE